MGCFGVWIAEITRAVSIKLENDVHENQDLNVYVVWISSISDVTLKPSRLEYEV